ncbi:hypothetical protein J4434_04160 [Candidatus Woesearchaeota archaeon]|nr:hypothetical protein [Candidatus Woesearchaeota archaeon]
MNQKQDIAALSFVLDSNIFISALIKDGITRKIILQSGFYFYAPYTFLDEINKHKEEIIQKADISMSDFKITFSFLLDKIVIVPLFDYNPFFNDAEQIMKNIDISDSSFLALALAMGIPIWSNDTHFRNQNQITVYQTKEIINLFFLE